MAQQNFKNNRDDDEDSDDDYLLRKHQEGNCSIFCIYCEDDEDEETKDRVNGEFI